MILSETCGFCLVLDLHTQCVILVNVDAYLEIIYSSLVVF